MGREILTIDGAQKAADAAWDTFYAALAAPDADVRTLRTLMKRWERLDKRLKVLQRLIPPTYAPPKRRGKNRDEHVHAAL